MNNTPSNCFTSVIFDLDGTLLDTAHDLGTALNQMLKARDLEPIAYDRIRPIASHGSRGLLELGFGDNFNTQTSSVLREEFLSNYESCLLEKTCYFEGIEELLIALRKASIKTAIVTNKPERYTSPVVSSFSELESMKSKISGDTLAVAKPNPAPLLLAAQELGARPEGCLYVGDAHRDIEAGNNAGMTTVLAQWGYFTAADEPENWGFNWVAKHPIDILTLLQSNTLR